MVDSVFFFAAVLRELREKYKPLNQQELNWAEERYELAIHEIDVLKDEDHWPDHVPAIEMLI